MAMDDWKHIQDEKSSWARTGCHGEAEATNIGTKPSVWRLVETPSALASLDQ